ncbi:MAG: Lrp/AsnC ligand binding domain-containing protein, partial [Nanoarchaeota archaeon]
VHAIIRLQIAKGKLFEVENKIAVHPNVFAVYDVTGEFDALVITKFKSRKVLDTFLKKIQGYDFVQRTETQLILNTIKERNIKVE